MAYEREVSLKDKVEISGKEKKIPVSAKRGYCESRNRFLFVCMFVLFYFFVTAVLERRRSGRGARSPEMGCIFLSGCCFFIPNLSSYSIQMAQESGNDSSCKLVQRCESREGQQKPSKLPST